MPTACSMNPTVLARLQVLSRFLADAINHARAPYEQAVASQGGRGQAHVILGQLVRGQQLEAVPGPNHERYPILIQAEDPVVAGPRRRGEMQPARQLLAIIQELPGPRVESAQQPEVIQHIKSPVIDERGRVVRSRQRLTPLDAGVVGLARLEGNITAAALVHFTYLCTLPLLMVCWGRRFGYPKAALFAAIVIFASPVIAKDGVSAYNDLAVVTLIFAVFYLLQVWDESKSSNLLIVIGLLSGAAYAAKYTAFLTLPFAFAWVCFSRRHFPSRRDLLCLILPALVMVAPWTLRNWFWVGN